MIKKFKDTSVVTVFILHFRKTSTSMIPEEKSLRGDVYNIFSLNKIRYTVTMLIEHVDCYPKNIAKNTFIDFYLKN